MHEQFEQRRESGWARDGQGPGEAETKHALAMDDYGSGYVRIFLYRVDRFLCKNSFLQGTVCAWKSKCRLDGEEKRNSIGLEDRSRLGSHVASRKKLGSRTVTTLENGIGLKDMIGRSTGASGSNGLD
jgi:hypothetical protein